MDGWLDKEASMTTATFTDLELVVLSKLDAALEEEADLAPGIHEFDFAVRVSGHAVREQDTQKTPTCRALTLETLALFIRRAGVQRDRALDILVDVLRENVMMDKDQKDALLKETGVAEAKERLALEMAKLPKTPVKGKFKFGRDVMVERVETPAREPRPERHRVEAASERDRERAGRGPTRRPPIPRGAF
jgi:hypothetical protein